MPYGYGPLPLPEAGPVVETEKGEGAQERGEALWLGGGTWDSPSNPQYHLLEIGTHSTARPQSCPVHS